MSENYNTTGFVLGAGTLGEKVLGEGVILENEYENEYYELMLNYYPEVIKDIREFQELIMTQSVEVQEVHTGLINILKNAYIQDADESRITQWEKLLGIVPLPQGEDTLETWLQDRRETILARLYRTEKLNSAAIADIVKIFTGGTATSSFKDSMVTVRISPPKDSKQYKSDNVEQELRKKLPAHLQLEVVRNYRTWGEIHDTQATWQDVLNNFTTWENVLFPYSK